MSKVNKFHLCFCILILASFVAKPNVLEWNLKSKYGINQDGFTSIIADARTYFKSSPNDTILVKIDAGTYNIGGNGGSGINLDAGMNPGINGRLIFEGAGMTTKLIFTETVHDMIHGKNVYRTEFRNMHMARSSYTVSQGLVVSIEKGAIVLEIQQGFPTPLDIWSDWTQGRFLRRYTKSLTDPQIIQSNNDQVPYGYRDTVLIKPELVQGRQWKFYLNSTTLLLNNYSIGDLVGVKSKHEGNTYWMSTGDDLVFNNIKWTGSSRGLVRGGFSNVRILNCRVDRDTPINGQTPCLSTPSGGLQINQYAPDPVSTGMVVDNFYCDSPGDDCVAFFNVNGGKVINSTLRNSFARGIMISQTAYDICVLGTTTPNSPIELENRGTILITPFFTWDILEAIDAGFAHQNCTSIITEINEENISTDFRITNQMNGFLIDAFNEDLYDVYVYNSNGQLVLNKNSIRGNISIESNLLNTGAYVVKIVSQKRMEHIKLLLN